MDLSQFAGTDYVDLEIDGIKYRVGELTLREWAPVQAWIKANARGPLSVLASPDFAALPPQVKREVLGAALDKEQTSWPPQIGTKPWFLALDNDGGHATALLAILGKNLPGITLEDCRRVADSGTFAEILPAFCAALGIFGPKSPAPSTPRRRKGPGGAKGRTTSAKAPTSSSRPPAGPGMTSST